MYRSLTILGGFKWNSVEKIRAGNYVLSTSWAVPGNANKLFQLS